MAFKPQCWSNDRPARNCAHGVPLVIFRQTKIIFFDACEITGASDECRQHPHRICRFVGLDGSHGYGWKPPPFAATRCRPCHRSVCLNEGVLRAHHRQTCDSHTMCSLLPCLSKPRLCSFFLTYVAFRRCRLSYFLTYGW